MRYLSFLRQWGRPRQAQLAFLERRIRLERRFKGAIGFATAIVVLSLLRAYPWNYLAACMMEAWAGQPYRDAIHLVRTREEIDASWREFFRADIEQTRPRIEKYYAEKDEPFRRLLRYAGMDPEHALLGSAQFGPTLLLSSKVFEADDRLSYRLHPNVQSIWLIPKQGWTEGNAFFLVPNGPDLAGIVQGTSMRVVEGSEQSTNSWGTRGPEPDPDAPLRVLVLGDSFMQGMFIGDDETPSEGLHRFLTRERKTRVSVLNTGVMGYSIDQYYYAMDRFVGRFHPHAVVVSLFANDCGTIQTAANRGEGDWQEARYWIGKIATECERHGWPYVVVPAPFSPNVVLRRRPGFYPGMLANALFLDGGNYLDPEEDFVNAHLKGRIAYHRQGEDWDHCVLFNDELHDMHFSAAGAEIWAESVGRRLLLLMEDQQTPPARATSARPDREGGPA